MPFYKGGICDKGMMRTFAVVALFVKIHKRLITLSRLHVDLHCLGAILFDSTLNTSADLAKMDIWRERFENDIPLISFDDSFLSSALRFLFLYLLS